MNRIACPYLNFRLFLFVPSQASKQQSTKVESLLEGKHGWLAGWGNNELEIYSDDNVLVSGGALSITATFDGVNFQSGRIRTFGKRDFVPSKDAPNGIRVEASIQMPIGFYLFSHTYNRLSTALFGRTAV